MKIKVTYNLYIIRKRKELTIRELESMSGVSKSEINYIENNKTNATVENICKIAIALGVKPEDLYSYECL